ncbi:MAG: GtrA family protein [Ruminococcaceae bacterium]|nr:GtrA family protein [Oscillospiraceae bacterium]
MKKFKEIFLYLLFGGLTTAVNIISFYFLDLIDLPTAVSTTLAWLISVIFAFITNKLFVFECHQNAFLKEMVSFFGCRVFTGVLDILIMLVFVDMFEFDSLLIKVLSNILVIILNFLFSKFFIFKKVK